MIKTIGYYLFASVYYICRPLPIQRNNVLCIMTHDEGAGSNVNIVSKALKAYSPDIKISYITKSDTLSVKSFSDIGKLFSFFFIKPYRMARAEIIFLDNIFLPFAYLKRKKETKVVQLWHGTGTIKKFGQDVNTGKLKELEKKANDNITHLIVNSPEMKKLYAGAFGVSENRTYPIGLPRTDELLQHIEKQNQTNLNSDKEYIYEKYRIPKDKKLILYAPTFRDSEVQNPRVAEYLTELLKDLPEEYVLGVRVHPFIAKAISNQSMMGDGRLYQLSFEGDLNTVLMASDLLITDYSSIIFEYCLLERPMIFFAYDLADFSDHGRGFYYDYESYVPGPVAGTGREVAQIIRNDNLDLQKVTEFKKRHYPNLDGNATGRLIDLLMK